MNAFELMLLIWVALSLLIAVPAFYAFLGPWGIPVGLLVGIGAGVLLLRMLRWVVAGISRILPPARPTCVCGETDEGGYSFKGLEGNSSVVVCKCGIRYVENGRSFSICLENGTLVPYKQRAFRGARWTCRSNFDRTNLDTVSLGRMKGGQTCKADGNRRNLEDERALP